MAEPLIHFLCGSTGAGKTTCALSLASRIGATRFSIDEWMSRLFWPDAPTPIDPVWAIERVERCRDLIWATAVDVAGRGTACVLEIGLVSHAARAAMAAKASEAGLAYRFHLLDVPADERWRRVEARNQAGGAQLDFAVTRAMFDFVETMWEPPSPDEYANHDWRVIR